MNRREFAVDNSRRFELLKEMVVDINFAIGKPNLMLVLTKEKIVFLNDGMMKTYDYCVGCEHAVAADLREVLEPLKEQVQRKFNTTNTILNIISDVRSADYKEFCLHLQWKDKACCIQEERFAFTEKGYEAYIQRLSQLAATECLYLPD